MTITTQNLIITAVFTMICFYLAVKGVSKAKVGDMLIMIAMVVLYVGIMIYTNIDNPPVEGTQCLPQPKDLFKTNQLPSTSEMLNQSYTADSLSAVRHYNRHYAELALELIPSTPNESKAVKQYRTDMTKWLAWNDECLGVEAGTACPQLMDPKTKPKDPRKIISHSDLLREGTSHPQLPKAVPIVVDPSNFRAPGDSSSIMGSSSKPKWDQANH